LVFWLTGQPITDAAYGDQSIVADLPPQITDIDLDGVRGDVCRIVPDMIKELCLADDPPALRIKYSRSTNSRGVRFAGAPFTKTSRLAGFSCTSPTLSTAGRARAPRRSSARIRASKTTKEKGLVR
jgi:hypothetical protein